MSVTLKQIAREVGVSQPIVSYALNGKPGVGPEMRSKILETAERMGYSGHSNEEARRLIAKRYGRRLETGVIGLLYSIVEWTLRPGAVGGANGDRTALFHRRRAIVAGNSVRPRVD